MKKVMWYIVLCIILYYGFKLFFGTEGREDVIKLLVIVFIGMAMILFSLGKIYLCLSEYLANQSMMTCNYSQVLDNDDGKERDEEDESYIKTFNIGMINQ